MVPAPSEQHHLNRRDLVSALAATALMLISGCAMFRRDSELDSAFAELDRLLQQVPETDSQQLIFISERIRDKARALIDVHETFVISFNERAALRSVSADDLESLVQGYESRRQVLRSEILQLQDELHAAVPPESWPQIREILNRKGQSIADRNVAEA